jgi:hypothetical protein
LAWKTQNISPLAAIPTKSYWRENIWYELWCDGSIVAERYAWPLDPTTKQPLVKNKLIGTQTRLCLEEGGRKKEMD